jgi:GTPase Era involved in 16S rRNA processing
MQENVPTVRRLQIKYHPAMKEIIFQRIDSEGKCSDFDSDDYCFKYMNQKDGFFLQNHGNNFFTDILHDFSGEKSLVIEVIATETDYNDFENMLNLFKETNDIKMNINTVNRKVLPDMDMAYQMIQELSADTLKTLQNLRKKFKDAPATKTEIKTWTEKIDELVESKIENITSKINAASVNMINLCFVGAYSAGKSALINAILHSKILPESKKSKTARMFKISKSADQIGIQFYINELPIKILWNDLEKCLELTDDSIAQDIIITIKDAISKNRTERQHKQISEILELLNSADKRISSTIDIFFPISLDTEKMKFTIYDTPGTDSNSAEHEVELQRALKEQTHSILVFVIDSDKLEGSGNSKLLSLIRDVNEKGKTYIDIERSFFVINKADDIKEPKERLKLQQAEIIYAGGKLKISLKDKRLFFASAKFSYAADAMKNDIAGTEEKIFYNQAKSVLSNKEYSCFYKDNKMANSEFATNKLIKYCDDALTEAENNNNEIECLKICSGTVALEKEIKNYGEKYSTAVRAFPVIESVNKTVKMIKSRFEVIRTENIVIIKDYEDRVKSELTNIQNEVDKIYTNYKISEGSDEQKENLKEKLHLKSENLESVLDEIDKALPRMFWFGPHKFKVEHQTTIDDIFNNKIKNYIHVFSEKQKAHIEEQCDSFQNAVRDSIFKNDYLPEEAKKFLTYLDLEENPPDDIEELGNLYKNSRIKRIFIGDTIDKKKFMEICRAEVIDIAGHYSNLYLDKFYKTFNGALTKVKEKFYENASEYSQTVSALRTDAEKMAEFMEGLDEAIKKINDCQRKLENAIWRENE